MKKNKFSIIILTIILLLSLSAWNNYRQKEWVSNPPETFFIYAALFAKWAAAILFGYLIVLLYRLFFSARRESNTLKSSHIKGSFIDNLPKVFKISADSLAFPFSDKKNILSTALQTALCYIPLGFILVMGCHARFFQDPSRDPLPPLSGENFKDILLKGIAVILIIASFLLPGFLLIRYCILKFDPTLNFNIFHNIGYILGSTFKPLILSLFPGHSVMLDKSLQIAAIAGLFSFLVGLFVMPAALIAQQTKDHSSGIFFSEISLIIDNMKAFYLLGIIFTYGFLFLFIWILGPFLLLYPLVVPIYGSMVVYFWRQLYLNSLAG